MLSDRKPFFLFYVADVFRLYFKHFSDYLYAFDVEINIQMGGVKQKYDIQ